MLQRELEKHRLFIDAYKSGNESQKKVVAESLKTKIGSARTDLRSEVYLTSSFKGCAQF